MALVQRQPLPGLASTVGNHEERIRGLEAKRLSSPVGAIGPAYSTTSTSALLPPGWPSVTVTIGVSAGCSVDVACDISPPTSQQGGALVLFVDGASTGTIATYSGGGESSALGTTTVSSFLIVGATGNWPIRTLSPGSHTFALGCFTLQNGAANAVLFSNPRLRVTPY